ncbi:hypothetical protein, partial [Seonamhaeicola marinus]|uniref:hypothetical protein n=1 Tax=Seonamhaeicola marinus TaxID=1912246 RepID=UPI001652A2BA
MEAALHQLNPKFRHLLTSLFLLLAVQVFADTNCGEINSFELTNGHETVSLMNNNSYILSDLPSGFYIKTNVSGNIKSVKYTVENLDTGKVYRITENITPYTFPAGNNAWHYGTGNFRITAKAFKYYLGIGECDSKTIYFSFKPPCE